MFDNIKWSIKRASIYEFHETAWLQVSCVLRCNGCFLCYL